MPVSSSVAHGLEAGLQPDPLLGGAGAGEVGVVLVLLHLLQDGGGVVDGVRRCAAARSSRRAGRPSRAVGTSSGLTSYAETQVTSSWTGSGASSTGRAWSSPRRPRRPRRRVSATRRASSSVSTTPEAKPQAPPWITRTAKPRSSASLRRLEDAVADAEVLVADPLEAEVGVAGAELLGPGQGARRRGGGRAGR